MNADAIPATVWLPIRLLDEYFPRREFMYVYEFTSKAGVAVNMKGTIRHELLDHQDIHAV